MRISDWSSDVCSSDLLAIVLPLYPCFGCRAATISWLSLVVEAVLAAPLWAFAHMRMDGHEFATEASKAGYRLSLNILMRPSLLLFGLVMSYIIFELFCGFMSERFTDRKSTRLNSSH